MEANGDLYLDRYEGWYSVRDEAYYDESELVEGEGEREALAAGHPGRMDGRGKLVLPPVEVPASRCSTCTATIPDFIQPESRRNEVLRFVEGGLRDLSVSRTSFDWGVKVPGSRGPRDVRVGRCADQLPDRARLSRRNGGHSRKFWPADLHLIGKDIVRFHAVYWPAFLMSAGLPLPKAGVRPRLPAQPRARRKSKSLGNVTDPLELADRFGVDPLRYFLLREFTFGQDGSYSRRSHRQPRQCRTGQQLRQPGAARAVA